MRLRYTVNIHKTYFKKKISVVLPRLDRGIHDLFNALDPRVHRQGGASKPEDDRGDFDASTKKNNFRINFLKFDWKLIILSYLLLTSLIFPSALKAQPLTPSTKFPRTANIYLNTINRSDYAALARYDVLVLIPEIQYYNPDFFAYARKQHPDIIILPYIYSAQVNIQGLDDTLSDLKRSFLTLATPERYLYTPTRERVDIWQHVIFAMNLNGDWPDVWPALVKQKVLDTGLWDGIYYDVVDDSITHFAEGNIDMNNDGLRDDPTLLNTQWRAGMTRLLRNTRSIIGAEKYIVVNGSSLEDYQGAINGRMFESFPTPWEGRGRWLDSMQSYLGLSLKNTSPLSTIINTNTRDKGTEMNYQQMRFGLASTLLGNGYSSFDFGPSHHAQLWWYDEYATALGRPTTGAVDLRTNSSTLAPSLWRRDFERGAAIVNSSDGPQHVDFSEDFEHLRGLQDASVNNGMITSVLDLNAHDGIVLLKPLEKIVNASYPNGAFARVFTADGQIKRTGFFSYTPLVTGGNIIAEIPKGESTSINIASVGNALQWVDDNGTILRTIRPYGSTFNGTFTFTLGDLTGDGVPEIVTIPTSNGSLHVRSFTLSGVPSIAQFNIQSERVRKNSIAVIPPPPTGGSALIVVGPAAGKKPIVSVYQINGTLKQRWGAFEGSFLSGLSVAVDPHRPSTILVGRNAPGKGEVRLFTSAGRLEGLFFAFRSTSNAGALVASADVDGDGVAEILALTTR